MDSETDCKIALLLGSTNDYSHTPGVCCKRKYKVLHLRRKKTIHLNGMEVDYLQSSFAEKHPGVPRDSKLNISQNGTLSTKKANRLLGCIWRTTGSMLKGVLPSLGIGCSGWLWTLSLETFKTGLHRTLSNLLEGGPELWAFPPQLHVDSVWFWDS